MVSDEDKLKADLYWKMYNEHATQARHHEILRGTISAILVSVSAGILSLYSSSSPKLDPQYSYYVAMTLIAIGVLGSLLSYKHYERNRLHVSTLRKFRAELDGILAPLSGSISAPNTKGREEHERDNPISSRWLRLHHLWMAIFIFIVGTGVVLAVVS